MAVHHPQSFDVCLLDFHLTGVNGVTLGAMIRACNPGVRLVLMSGSCDPQMRQLAFEHGFHAAIAKPVRLAELTTALFEPVGTA
jgi:CheY-like chemotaxis protein